MATDPIYILVEPGWLAKFFFISAAPAFVVGDGLAHRLGRFGVSEVVSFMASMPLLIVAWFYFVGRLLDWWASRSRVLPRPD